MASAKLFDMSGEELGSVDLNGVIFDVAPNPALIHDVIVAYRNAQRQGNAETKVRRAVRGGGAKPFRQKGTGRARQGSTREPQMRGGGTVFGPHKRSYRQRVSMEFKRQALCCALSDRVRSEALCVLDAFNFELPKTKPFATLVDKFSPDGRKTLFVTADVNRNAVLSSRNLPGVAIRTVHDVNALDVLDAARVVVVQNALAKLEGRLA